MSLTCSLPWKLALVLTIVLLPQCNGTSDTTIEEGSTVPEQNVTWVATDSAAVKAQLAKMAPFELTFDSSALTGAEKELLARIPEIGRAVDRIWLTQSHPQGNRIFAELKRQYERNQALGNQRLLEYFWICKGPYDPFELKPYVEWRATDGSKGKFPPFYPGRNFYPLGLTAEEFNTWADSLPPAAAALARSDFTAIRRDSKGSLTAEPYSKAYAEEIKPLAAAMRKAAADVDGTMLGDFLLARADAIQKTNDFEQSEALWIGLNGPDDKTGGHIDITIGPYENYGDELMKRKAAFQLYAGVLRPSKTKALAFYEREIHKMDDRLWDLFQQYVAEDREVAPGKKLGGGMKPERWKKPGAKVTLVAVDLVYSAGYANEGYQTLAYNLPNISAWQAKYGSKKVMMMNMLDGKFINILKPIAAVVMHPDEKANVDQELFSDNTVRHEVSHGIGPSGIYVGGKLTEVRERHQKYYSPFEEAKAEIVSLLFGFHLAEMGVVKDPEFTAKMAATYTASTFRTVRFGVASDHARGKVFEFNRLIQNGGIVVEDGKFRVDLPRFRVAVEKLAMEIMDLQCRGTMEDAKSLLEKMGQPTADLDNALQAIAEHGIPVDLRVKYVMGDNWGVIK